MRGVGSSGTPEGVHAHGHHVAGTDSRADDEARAEEEKLGAGSRDSREPLDVLAHQARGVVQGYAVDQDESLRVPLEAGSIGPGQKTTLAYAGDLRVDELPRGFAVGVDLLSPPADGAVSAEKPYVDLAHVRARVGQLPDDDVLLSVVGCPGAAEKPRTSDPPPVDFYGNRVDEREIRPNACSQKLASVRLRRVHPQQQKIASVARRFEPSDRREGQRRGTADGSIRVDNGHPKGAGLLHPGNQNLDPVAGQGREVLQVVPEIGCVVLEDEFVPDPLVLVDVCADFRRTASVHRRGRAHRKASDLRADGKSRSVEGEVEGRRRRPARGAHREPGGYGGRPAHGVERREDELCRAERQRRGVAVGVELQALRAEGESSRERGRRPAPR
ncbi:MAG: hypothetical protein KatS3mg076_2399 [Candidatus Binatia bacterium]|nr:MAG: hypothetical protein KatS3mg076_2399 [Candidatus Binatia bacterium]